MAQETDKIIERWREIAKDPMFAQVVLMVQDRMPHRRVIEELPHAQHVADGFRSGFAAALNILRKLDYDTKAPDSHGQSGQMIDPDLDDFKNPEPE